MKTRMRIMIGSALVVALVGLVTACGSDKKSEKTKGVVDQMVDTVATTFANNLQQAQKAQPVVADENKPNDNERLVRHVADLSINNDKLYAAYDGGVAVYDFVSRTDKVVRDDQPFDAVAWHEGKLYVGGNDLYTLDDSLELQKVDSEFEGTVTALCEFGPRLIIGTSNGLYSQSIFGKEKLMDDVTVSALVADEGGLWVGTDGQGLYRWDGSEFARRYLLRDTSIFDTVRTLAYNHNHLYVGSSNGFHVFDGGKWATMTTGEGLPSDCVTSIDASDWVVLVGTDQGVVSYFNDELMPVSRLDDKGVTAIRRYKNKIIAGTEYEGVLQRSRTALRTIVQPDSGLQLSYLSLIQ
jgi:ligand-binding sensor domain-containing protein